ncbi:hypothetical protein C8R42DRAFT_723254 [Lentinula raphanica]|nr:hypothetical protein C8R42DRAFT_723254 [Lentinula raphanica]
MLLTFGAASFVVVSAIPIDMKSRLSLNGSAASTTSTPTSNSHTPTSTSPSQLSTATLSPHPDNGTSAQYTQEYDDFEELHRLLFQSNDSYQHSAPPFPEGTTPGDSQPPWQGMVHDYGYWPSTDGHLQGQQATPSYGLDDHWQTDNSYPQGTDLGHSYWQGTPDLGHMQTSSPQPDTTTGKSSQSQQQSRIPVKVSASSDTKEYVRHMDYLEVHRDENDPKWIHYRARPSASKNAPNSGGAHH